MPDPTTIQTVASSAGSITALISYYAPAAVLALSTVVWPKYIQPVLAAVIQLPGLMKEQNMLLAEANKQRATTARVLERKP